MIQILDSAGAVNRINKFNYINFRRCPCHLDIFLQDTHTAQAGTAGNLPIASEFRFGMITGRYYSFSD